MSRFLSSQITTGLRRALRQEAGSRASTGSPLGGKVRRPGRFATWAAAAAVLVTLSTQPAEAFAAAHAGVSGGPVTPQQLSEGLGNLKHRVGAADTSIGGAGTGKGHQRGKGELPAMPAPEGLGASRLSGAPVAQTGAHSQPPADLRDRQLAAGGKPPAAAKAAGDATATAGIPGAAPTGTEITSLRTATTSVFQNPDGTRTMRVYSRPVHFRKSDGTWGNIDTRLAKDAAGRWTARAGDQGTSFADSADDPALVSWALDAGHQVSYGLQGAGTVAAKVSGNTITYPDAEPSTDVVYDALATSIKETLVLHDASAPTSFTFPLSVTGLTAALDKTGDVVFTDASGKVDLVIPRGFMRDSAHHGDGQVSGGVTYQLTAAGGQQALQVNLDAAWLHDPHRVFPVRVDPTSTGSTQGQTTTSTYVETPYNTNFSSDVNLKVGTYDGGGHQATGYIEFPSIGTSSLQNTYIEKVTLNADAVDGSQCNTATEVDVRQIVGSWNPSTVTVASQVPLGSKIGQDTFKESNQNGCISGAVWIPFDLGDNASADGTKMVEDWVHGGSNYGVALTADLTDTNAWKVFNSASSMYPPYLSVTYSTYGADYSTPTSYIPPTSTSTGSQSVTLTNRGTTSWTSSNMKLKARLYDANWNEISTSAPLTAIPSTVAPNGSVTMTGTIPAIAPGKSYQLCWDMYVNGTDSLQTSYGVPFQNCTWVSAADIPPQIDTMEPLSNATVPTLMPQLHADAHDPDNYPGTGLTYDFQVYGPTGIKVADSGWITQTSWPVPRGVLAWNSSYSWVVAVSDSKAQSAWSSAAAFSTQVPQPLITSHLASAGDAASHEFDAQTGNYTTSATDANVKAVGPQLAVNRSYNSLDPRTSGMFGAGWSSLYDMQVQPDGDSSGGVRVTGADGRVERFGRNDYALASATGVGDLTGDHTDDVVAVDDAAGDLYMYAGPNFSAATRLGLSHTDNFGGTGPAGNWSTLTWLTGADVNSDGTGDLVGVDPSTGKLWEWASGSLNCPATGIHPQFSGVGGSSTTANFSPNLPFNCTPVDISDGTDWRTMSQLAITPPLSGDGKMDLVAVENSTGYMWAYPISSTGTLGTRVELGTGWGGHTLIGGSFAPTSTGVGSILTINSAGNLEVYSGSGTGTLGTSTMTYHLIASGGWSNMTGLAPVAGISGDPGSDFLVTDSTTGIQYLYHSTGSYSGTQRTVTGMSLYTSPAGESEQLYRQSDGSWILREKGGITYTFAQHTSTSAPWQLSKITDKEGRTQTLTYNSDGTLAAITDTISQHALHLTWNTAKTHIASVSTDPVVTGNSSTALTWNYTYSSSALDELDKVCAPPTGTNTSPSCTQYGYTSGSTSGSHFRSAVMDASPRSYWRFNETQGATATSEVIANEGSDNAAYTGVNLAATGGPLPGSPTTAAGFNGSSSYVTLPKQQLRNSYASIGLWFKATGPGMLVNYQNQPMGSKTAPSHASPVLYIGTDGMLRGELYGPSIGSHPITTSAAVTYNAWHYVVLSAAGNTQSLYLDGQQVGSALAGQVDHLDQDYTVVGAGDAKGETSWPADPTYASNGYNYFNGDIAEVALYDHALGAPAVAQQYQAGHTAATELTSITTPLNKTKLGVVYDAVNDRASKITDKNGGTWTIHPSTVAGSTQQYRASVLGSSPAGYWRLSDGAGTQAANQIYADRTTPNNGTYSNVTLGAVGPFPTTSPPPLQGTQNSAAATFDGTTSWTELPAANAVVQGPGAVGVWFKTTSTAGGVLFADQSFPVGTAPGTGDVWNPALYVGTDSKLHGELWNGTGGGNALASTTTVNDGKWHYALIDATTTTSQTLYLDGAAQGTLAGTVAPQGAAHVYLGAGTATNWPSAPGDPDGHFNGTLAAAAVFPMGLNTTQVTALSTAPTGSGGSGPNPSTNQQIYDAGVIDLHPLGYWPLDDAGGNQATELLTSAAKAQNQAVYSNTTCCVGGPWASGATSGTGFNPANSSYVQLPGTVATLRAPSSIEVWFKTSTAGVIYSYQSFPLGNTPNGTTDRWDPALYVDTNGYLRGELYTGGVNQAVSSVKPSPGVWHMAALVASGTSQQLYLDGQPTGSPVTGTVTYDGEGYAYLGAGYDAGGWTNASTDANGHFNGNLADFATYSYALSANTILGDYQAATTADNGTGMNADDAYRARIVQDGAQDYWRLDDRVTSAYAPDELGTALPDPYAGTYTSATLNTAGPSGNPDEAAATFNGTSSQVQLPATASPRQGAASIELWFKTSNPGVLYSYQSMATGSSIVTGDSYNPGLYVGSDNKLHGLFLDQTNSASDLLSSTGTVTDNKWHQAVLAATGTSETLYLDGTQQATESKGTLQYNGGAYVYLGAGTISSAWANAPTTDSTSTSYFNGSLAEAAYYDTALTQAAVTAHYKAMATASSPTPVTTSIVTDPGGNTLTYRYDTDNGGRELSTTDAYGDTTSYTYDTSGYLNTVTDADGHTTTYGHDVDGNTVSTTSCLNPGNCQTGYATYYINALNALDPGNDEQLTSSDARSSSATDTTYQTGYGYDSLGNRTSTRRPDGSMQTSTFTAGTEAAVGGGTEPPGLLSTSTDFNQNKTSYFYKSNGDLDHTVNPSGLTTTYAYDGLGRVSSQAVTCTDCSAGAQTTTTSYTWDGHGNPLTEQDPTITDPVNGTITHTRVTTNAYDADGDRTSQTVSDATGNDKARITTWAYTNTTNDLVTSTTDPAGHSTTYAYDAYGNLTSKTDPAGTQYAYTYSPMGQLQSTAIANYTGNPDNPVTAYWLTVDSRAYDPAGRLATDTDAMGRSTHTYYYDDNLVSEVDLDAFHDFNPQTKAFTGTTRNVVEETDSYDAAGNLTQRTTGGGKTTVTSAYDTDGRVTSSTLDPAGLNRTTSYTYDNDNHVLSTKVTGGAQTRETDNTYDALGDTTKTTVINTPVNSVTTSTYDQAGQLTSSVSPDGNATGATPANYTTTYTYDALGEPTQTIAPPVSTTTFNTTTGTATTGTASAITAIGYNTFGEAADTKDADGNITTYTHTFDTAGAHLSVAGNTYTAPGTTTAVTPVTQTDYDVLGRTLRTTVDPTGLDRVTSYKYDQLGDQVETDLPIVNGIAPAWTGTFDLDGEALSTTSPTGAQTQATYDDLGRMITLSQLVRQPAQGTASPGPTSVYTAGFGYDDASNKTTTVDPAGQTSTASFDAAGETTSTTDSLNRTSTFAYDLAGDAVKATEPGPDSTHNGASTTTTYDLAGNPVTTANLDGTGNTVGTTTSVYDQDGNPISVGTVADDGTTSTSTATYDAMDRLTQQIQPTSATHSITTTYAYDAAGNRTSYTDGNGSNPTYKSATGNTTYTTYNTLGLSESVIDPATSAYPNVADRSYTTGYDTAGEPVTYTEPGGVTQTSTYNAAGQLTNQTGAGAEATTTSRTFGYDADGRLTSLSTPTGTEAYTYDDRSNLISSSGPAGTASFTYDADGRQASRTDKSGTTNYTYNAAGQLSTLADPATGATLNYAYYGNGDLKTVNYGNGGPTQTYSYNAQHQVTQNTLTTGGGTTTIASQAYSYYPSGRVKTQTNTGLAGPNSNTYTYDQAGRLSSWNNGTSTTSYAYDDNGNLTRRGSTTAAYNERNQLTTSGTTSYNYTARGTLQSTVIGGTATTTSTYDAFDKLISQGPQTYAYDAAGRLTNASGSTLSYDDTSDAVTSDGTENYTRAPDGGLVSLTQNGTSTFGYTDNHGDLVGAFSTTATTLASSTSYDPWGQPNGSSGTMHDIGYQGGWTDPSTGQINTASRWYNPATADFTSRDTSPLNPATSATGNLYAYANDNPIQNADPSGNYGCIPNGPSPAPQPFSYPAWDYGGYGNGYAFDSYDQYYQYAYGYGAWIQNGLSLAQQNYLIYGWGGYGYGGGMDPSQPAPWLVAGGGGGLAFGGGMAAGDWFGGLGFGMALAFGANSCLLPAPPVAKPRPIDWHTEKPKPCAASECTTKKQPGHENGPEADKTRQGKPGPESDPQGKPRTFIDPWIISPGDTSEDDGQNPTCLRNGQGWEDPSPVDPSNGNRATGIEACLNTAYLDDHPGTDTKKSIRPPGYNWLLNYAGYLGAIPQQYTVNNCHLLGRQTSGSGTDLRNLVPCGADGNSYVGKKDPIFNMNDVEDEVAAIIKAGGTVDYTVVPLYAGGRTVPYAFRMSYVAWNVLGQPLLPYSTQVPNLIRAVNGTKWFNVGLAIDSRTGQPVPLAGVK